MRRKETSLASPHARSRTSVNVDLRTVKLAKSYNESSGIDTTVEYGNISSILEELYAWEKKLYKEVKVCKKLFLLSIHNISMNCIYLVLYCHIYPKGVDPKGVDVGMYDSSNR